LLFQLKIQREKTCSIKSEDQQTKQPAQATDESHGLVDNWIMGTGWLFTVTSMVRGVREFALKTL
jgi:hypothetical protein